LRRDDAGCDHLAVIERDVSYTRCGDLMIAYQVTGEGNAIDVVLTPGIVSHLDLDWDFPSYARFFEELSSFCRLIRFDKRGTGLSDRTVAVATLEERADDIRAVMDAVGSEQAYIFGQSEGGNMACVFAATNPDRTLGLLTFGTIPRYVVAPEHPLGRPVGELEETAALVEERGITREFLRRWPNLMDDLDDEEFALNLRYYRGSVSPAQMAAILRMAADIDMSGMLGSIGVPTLLLHRTDDLIAPVDAARRMAAAIPSARLIEFAGTGHNADDGPDMDLVIETIHEFVVGERRKVPVDRVLATVMFTDIVDSTAMAAALGDARWKDLLARHDRRVQEEVERHRGTLVRTTGDGVVVTFDGPARAARCAGAIVRAVRPIGIEVRAGCHTGEVELGAGEIQGLAVHIGARVMALAAPSEVLVSRTVRDLVAGSGLVFEDRGEHELKGVPERWQLFSLRDDGDGLGSGS
jgi:class 3 adenylate cyclase